MPPTYAYVRWLNRVWLCFVFFFFFSNIGFFPLFFYFKFHRFHYVKTSEQFFFVRTKYWIILTFEIISLSREKTRRGMADCGENEFFETMAPSLCMCVCAYLKESIHIHIYRTHLKHIMANRNKERAVRIWMSYSTAPHRTALHRTAIFMWKFIISSLQYWAHVKKLGYNVVLIFIRSQYKNKNIWMQFNFFFVCQIRWLDMTAKEIIR